MALLELFVAVLVAGVSVLNTALPIATWARSHDGRFLLVAGSSGLFAVLAGLWVWGQLPLDPPGFAEVGLPVLVLALGAVVLLFGATLWPRGS